MGLILKSSSILKNLQWNFSSNNWAGICAKPSIYKYIYIYMPGSVSLIGCCFIVQPRR